MPYQPFYQIFASLKCHCCLMCGDHHLLQSQHSRKRATRQWNLTTHMLNLFKFDSVSLAKRKTSLIHSFSLLPFKLGSGLYCFRKSLSQKQKQRKINSWFLISLQFELFWFKDNQYIFKGNSEYVWFFAYFLTFKTYLFIRWNFLAVTIIIIKMAVRVIIYLMPFLCQLLS